MASMPGGYVTVLTVNGKIVHTGEPTWVTMSELIKETSEALEALDGKLGILNLEPSGSNPEPGSAQYYADLSMDAASHIPSATQEVTCPAACFHRGRLWYTIQHLNDAHLWSFEKIADWLDDLHTSGQLDLTVQPPNEEDE